MPDMSCNRMIRILKRAIRSLLTAFATSKTSSRNAGRLKRSLNCSGFRGRPVSGWNVSSTEHSERPRRNSRLPLQIFHHKNCMYTMQIHDPNTKATWIVNCDNAQDFYDTYRNAINGTTDRAPDFFVSSRR